MNTASQPGPGTIWRKSSRSGASSGDCVEIAAGPQIGIAIRDSKTPASGHLAYSPIEWSAFTARIKHGGYDL